MADYDIAVIGAGAAGLSVAYVTAQLGLRTALIERDRMGGDCLNAGCVPSKALLAAAHAAQGIRDAARYGVHAEPMVDWDAVRAHVHRAVAELAPADSPERYRALGADVIAGSARFVSRNALEVATADGPRRLTARRIVIAAGSRAAVPAVPGLGAVPFQTNATLFERLERPDHLVILGGGAVGVEMAQAHAALGCRVTLVERGALLSRDDPELVDVLRQALLRAGVVVIEHADITRAEAGPGSGPGSGPTLVLADGRHIAGSHLLVAAGRTPNLDGLDLAAGGVTATARGIATNAGLRSSTNRRVFAVGDIADPVGIGPRYLTHVGTYHAGVMVRALFRLPARIDYAALPHVVFTDPELAQAGLTEAEARAAGHPIKVLRWPLADNDRAVAEARTQGLAKLVTSRGRVLGAGIAAPHAGEMIGAWTLAIGHQLKQSALAGMVVAYPTRAEAAKRALGTALLARLFAPRVRWLVRRLVRLP